MIRNRTRAITTTALAAGLVLTGAGMAAASPATPPLASATKTGIEYIQEMSTSATSPVSQVIAHGAFTAVGTDTQIGDTDLLQFPGGTFVATSEATSVQNRVDSGTCATTLTIKLTYKLGKGTGQFAGITGSGHATTTVLNLAVPTAHGGCSPTASVAQQSLVEASGPVTLR